MTMAMDKIVPDTLPWRHVDEGPDDSSSHTKVDPPSFFWSPGTSRPSGRKLTGICYSCLGSDRLSGNDRLDSGFERQAEPRHVARRVPVRVQGGQGRADDRGYLLVSSTTLLISLCKAQVSEPSLRMGVFLKGRVRVQPCARGRQDWLGDATLDKLRAEVWRSTGAEGSLWTSKRTLTVCSIRPCDVLAERGL